MYSSLHYNMGISLVLQASADNHFTGLRSNDVQHRDNKENRDSRAFVTDGNRKKAPGSVMETCQQGSIEKKKRDSASIAHFKAALAKVMASSHVPG